MRKAVEVIDLKKSFGGIRALDGVSFSVYEGEVFGLIGPNGAGKTTTLRIIATLLTPNSGEVRVFGLNVLTQSEEVRRLISYLPEEAGAYRNLSGREYLELMAKIYSSKSSEVSELVREGVGISGLGSRLKDKVKTYSRGMVRRLLLARALMIKPKLAILDEPTSGLDVVHAFYVRRIIKEFCEKHGITVLISSHNMFEVEYLCNRVALIDRGRIVEVGSPKELIEKHGVRDLEEVFIKVCRFA